MFCVTTQVHQPEVFNGAGLGPIKGNVLGNLEDFLLGMILESNDGNELGIILGIDDGNPLGSSQAPFIPKSILLAD